MLSVASVKSASGSATYFAKDDYYTREHSSEMTAWGGEGAAALGLSGAVDRTTFENILNGVLPNGQQVGNPEDRRLGLDLTFSMPKSASVLNLVFGDDRISGANVAAVTATLTWAGKVLAEGRTYERTKNGEPVRTGNLVYALFQHDTSRALDPQGHVHAIIANLTKMPNGTWQALRNDELWTNNTVLGSVYHAALREELEKLGYQTEITGKHGQFEIKGVPAEVIKEFSQRRADILEKAEELGVKSHAARDAVTINTRDPKLNVEDRAQLRQDWRDRAAALRWDGKDLIAEAKGRAARSADDQPRTFGMLGSVMSEISQSVSALLGPKDPLVDRGLRTLLSPTELRTQIAVASAIRILSQREAAFDVKDVGYQALNLGLRGVTMEKVDGRVSELIRGEKLIPGVSNRVDKAMTHVTTPEAIKLEEKIQGEIERGRGKGVALVAPTDAPTRLQAAAGDIQLNEGQLAAATMTVTSEDRIVAIQGVAGAGKSTVLSAIARVAEAEGKSVLGLAVQNKIAGALRDDTGIESTTVSSFVNQYARPALQGQGDRYDAARAALKGTWLVLDEGSMAANEPMRHVLGIANAMGVEKVVLVGDRQQIQPIDAGKAFSLIQASGVTMERMDENLRQRTDLLKTVAGLTNVGQARKALDVLGDKVVESKDHVREGADRWLALSPADRERTSIFSSGRESRAQLNTYVQDGLRADGTLKGDGATLTVLERVNVTREEMRYAHTYKPGQVLEVARTGNGTGLSRGSYDVLGVDEKGRVRVKGEGREKRFDPAKIDPKDKRDALGLSTREQVKVHEGDRLRWTMNDKDRGLFNSDLARVVSASKDGIVVETSGKQLLELKAGDKMLERLGLAYALNMHMAQGMTADRGIGVVASWERNLSNQRLFNVMATRVRDDITVVTDDRDKLARQLESNPGNKTSALEVTGRIEIDKPRASPAGSPSAAPARERFDPKVPDGLGRSADGPSAPGPRERFDPKLPDALEKASRAVTAESTRVPGVEPKPEQSRVPERYIDLGR